MRWLLVLLVCAALHPALFEGSINGVWVLNERFSCFTSPVTPERVVMEVDGTAPGWVSVVEVRTDARGQHLQSDQYAIRAGNSLLVAQKTTSANNRFLLRSQSTGAIEEWTMAPDGLLIIRRSLPTELGTKQDLLVFQRAERLGLRVVK